MLPFCFVPRQSLDKIKNAWEFFGFFFSLNRQRLLWMGVRRPDFQSLNPLLFRFFIKHKHFLSFFPHGNTLMINIM